jgi:hypothetical protein
VLPKFDWERFLRTHHVDAAPSGARQVVVHCPFCGPDDPSHHMSINLDGRGWRCWRAPESHFGRAPTKLVQKMLGCTIEEALRITGADAPPPPPTSEALVANLARLRGQAAPAPTRPRRLVLPEKFHPLTQDDERSEPFWHYLTEVRGYRASEARWLAEAYDLHWAVTGPYAWRLIFPVRDRYGDLLTWTARAVGATAKLRYKQPPDDLARTPAPRTLLGLDWLWRAPDPRVLVLCEGPLDATRITVSGASMGVWATCLFGLNLSADQRDLILELAAARFPRVALLLDATADRDRLRIARQLTPLRLALPRLPPGSDDPGELTAAQAAQLCLEMLD